MLKGWLLLVANPSYLQHLYGSILAPLPIRIPENILACLSSDNEPQRSDRYILILVLDALDFLQLPLFKLRGWSVW
jgi:hypothetical protein